MEHLFRTYGHNRHHGTWYIARSCMAKALILLAAAKSGRMPLPSGWKEALEIARWTVNRWSGEASDLEWAQRTLESIVGEVEKHM